MIDLMTRDAYVNGALRVLACVAQSSSQEMTMPSEAECQQMEAGGFTWDPTEP